MHFLDLPDTILIEIFEYMTYDEVARKREVCRRFDIICRQVLNAGFNKVTCEHNKNFKRIKALLPRRESERRNHCLARHADILTSIETRISMLSMTYSKYMDLNLCCFIPGRVLDEIYNILGLISTTNKQLRPHEVLQELRDISSMAIEHFDEKIAVTFKLEQSAKFVEQNQLHSVNYSRNNGGSLATLSFKGAGAKQLNSVIAAPSNTEANNHCCDSMIQRVQRFFTINNKSNALPENVETNATNTLNIFKQFERKYQKGLFKIRRLKQSQNIQTRRLYEANTAIAELTTQVSELKKQLEDIVANNHKYTSNQVAELKKQLDDAVSKNNRRDIQANHKLPNDLDLINNTTSSSTNSSSTCDSNTGDSNSTNTDLKRGFIDANTPLIPLKKKRCT